MKIRQRWYRRHQVSNQSNNQSLLLRLFNTPSVTSRLLAFYDDDYSVPVLSQNWQVLEPDLEKIHSAQVSQVLLLGDGGTIDGRIA